MPDTRLILSSCLLMLVTTCIASRPAAALVDSGPIVASYNGQVIENLRIEVTGRPAIVVNGLSNVAIRNVEILHKNANGIQAFHADDLSIDNVNIVHTGTQAPNPTIEQNNIFVYSSHGLVVRNARLTGGSAGIYVLESPGAHLSFLEGHNFRGPNPRGQLAQFSLSAGGLLEDFSVTNVVGVASPEDVVSIYQSSRTLVRRGLVDGNDSTHGVGVNIEFSEDCLIEDVDAIHQSNGSFGAHYSSSITFRRTRAKDNICHDQGRGRPASGGIIWSGYNNVSGLRIEDSQHWNRCNPSAIVYDVDRFFVVQLREQDFTPRAPIALRFPWERDDPTHPHETIHR
jgi:Right handed beta helix region